MNLDYNKLNLKVCGENDVNDILSFQTDIFNTLNDKDWLRENSKEMFLKCVKKPNITFGLYDKDLLVAIIIMYAIKDEEDLSRSLEKHQTINSANFKLIMVKKEYRGMKLMKSLAFVLEKHAYRCGYTHLCATVSSENIYSLDNIISSGFEYDSTKIKYGSLDRDVYVKDIRENQNNYLKQLEETTDLKDLKKTSFKSLDNYYNYGDLVEFGNEIGVILNDSIVQVKNEKIEIDKIKDYTIWITTE